MVEIIPPFHVSAFKGQTATLKRLIKAGCDVNQAANDGSTPALIAAQEGQTAALDILVKAGCDVNQAAKDGSTPAFILSLIHI